MLGLHLVPNGVDGLDAGFHLEVESQLLELGYNGLGKVVVDLLTRLFGLGNFLFYLVVGIGVLIFEGEVLELGFDGKQSQAVGQRGVDVEGFTGNLVLLAGEHGAEGAHVVQAVGHLDEDDPNVFRHGEQQPAEILGLGRGLVAKDTARDFGESIDYRGYLFAKMILDILDGVFGIFDHVVQQGGTYR